MTIHSTQGGSRAARARRTALVLGTTLGLAAALTACDVTITTGGEETASPSAEAPAPADDAAGQADGQADGQAQPAAADAGGTADFEAGLVPEGWREHDVECGMDVADLPLQVTDIRVELTGELYQTDEGAMYAPVRVENDNIEPSGFLADVQLVWSQGGVVVDLDAGWTEGGGLLIETADASGNATGQYAEWERETPGTITMEGVKAVNHGTTCLPGDENSGMLRQDGTYEVRAVVGWGEQLAVSEPMTVEWVNAVG